ncbi:MAG: nucleotidyl transferase [Marinilabiliales bacterium]|nr:MAG: nucleotidyl transferase [Marinilabiliales bacterium]
MKALLLSAGYGTRLKPLTDNIPKCLLPVNNKPLIFHWLEILENEGIDEVIINTHYLHEKVTKTVNERNNKIKINFFFEEELLGSAGTLFANEEILAEANDFLILYADNYTEVSLKPLIDFHKKTDALYTTYVYKTDVPHLKGIYEYNSDTGKAISFEEKPANPKSNIANAGIGVLNKHIFKYNKGQIPCDFGKDILDQITDQTYLMLTKNIIQDIGTPEDYYKLQEVLKKKKEIDL